MRSAVTKGGGLTLLRRACVNDVARQAGKENIGTNVYVDGRGAGSFLLTIDQQIDVADSTG